MNASPFNQNLSGWEIGNVKDMTQMFERTSMDQSLCWDLKDVLDTTGMFENTKIRMECLPTSTPNVTNTQDPTGNPSIPSTNRPFKSPSNEPSIRSSDSPESEDKSSAGSRQTSNGLNLVICLLLSFALSLCLISN